MTVLIFSSCYKESYWLDDNATGTGKFFPNVFFNNLDSTSFSTGGSVRCYIEYWSKDKIKEIRFYDSIGTARRAVVATIPYTPAYSTFKKADTLVYNYKVPATVASKTNIRLDAEVVNENGLTRVSNRLTFAVK
jgi:uncharacterized FlgJ-related protein